MVLCNEKEKRLCKRRFYNFFVLCWNVVWPNIEFEDAWYYEILCDELQRQAIRISEGQEKKYDIIINVPPRTAKSTLVVIAFNAWVWINFPSQKFLTASHADSLSIEHAVRTRRLIQSDWYQSLFGGFYNLLWDQNVKSFFENDKGGYRIAASVGSQPIGKGGDYIMVDDPHSPRQALSEAFRATCISWWNNVMHFRLNNQKVGLRIIIMQRLHEDDLTGYILEHCGNMYKHFCLPAEISDNVRPVELKKYYVNGLLFPERLGKKQLADTKIRIGSQVYAAQMEQRPSPEEGGMFKRIWWKFWKPKDMVLAHIQTKASDGSIHTHELINFPHKFDEIIISWDMTFKNTTGTDRVAGQVWGRVGTDKYLLDQNLGNMDFVQTKKAVLDLYEQNKEATAILIEDTANGPAVISELDRNLSILVPVKPLGSKISRATDASKAMSMVAQCEAGHLYLPHPAIASWVNDFIEEYTKFPFGKHDDQVDAGTQAIARLSSSEGFGFYTASMFEQHRKENEADG